MRSIEVCVGIFVLRTLKTPLTVEEFDLPAGEDHFS